MSKDYVVIIVDTANREIDGASAKVYMRFTEKPSDAYMTNLSREYKGKKVFCLLGASMWWQHEIDIPKKFSVDKNHPYFVDTAGMWDLAQRMEVTLNGEKRSMVVTYDIESGWLEEYEEDMLKHRSVMDWVPVRKYGKVEVSIKGE